MTDLSKRIWFLVGLVGFSVAMNLIFFGNPLVHGDRRKAPLFASHFGDRRIDLKDEIGKKIILVNFWATFCPPCRDEVPLLNQLVQKVSSDRFMIVAVMEDNQQQDDAQRQEALNNFTIKIPINYPVFSDEDGHIADLYGTYKLPESYLIDANGDILEKQVGPYSPQQMDSLARKIKAEIAKL